MHFACKYDVETAALPLERNNTSDDNPAAFEPP